MPYFQQNKANLFMTNILILINIIIIADGAFMTPLWSNFVLQIGGNLQTAGQAVLVFSMIIGVFMWFAGRIEHYYQNDEWFMCFSAVIVFLSYLGYFFVHHPWQLYAVEAGLGFGGAFQTPAICAIYQRYFTQEQSSFFWAVWNGFFNIAIGIGAMLSAFLVMHFTYRLMFSILALTAFFCLLLNIFLMMKIKQVGFFTLWRLKKPHVC